MTITDIDSCAALIFSNERVRRRSRKSKNAPRNKKVAVKNFVMFCSGYSLENNAFVTETLLLQNAATDTKFSYFFPHTLDSCHPIISFSFFFRIIQLLTNKYIYTINAMKKCKNSFLQQDKK